MYLAEMTHLPPGNYIVGERMWAAMSYEFCLASETSFTEILGSPFFETECACGGLVRVHCRRGVRGAFVAQRAVLN